jgi:hypothetical protein
MDIWSGDWVKLFDEDGYLALAVAGAPGVVEQNVSFWPLCNGSFADYGFFPVYDYSPCQGVAQCLSYSGNNLLFTADGGENQPQGCYVFRAFMFFASWSAQGRPARPSRLKFD